MNKSQRGQGLVEFALLCPMLLLLIVGLCDFGIAFASDLNITNSVREGARYASINPAQCGSGKTAGSILNVVENENGVAVIKDSYVTVTEYNVSRVAVACGDKSAVTVKVAIKYPFVGILQRMTGIGKFNLSASSTMVIEP